MPESETPPKKSRRRFNQKHYDMLMRCLKAKDMTEWNKWREGNPSLVPQLEGANLQEARLWEANLQGASLFGAHLEDADFSRALVDGVTMLADCSINRNTYFDAVGLASARIQPGLRVALEGNIRRIEWESWYKKHRVMKWPVRLFWWVSDYGMNTVRIIGTFFLLAFAFGILYYLFPGLICYLKEAGNPPKPVSPWILPFRALYFSVVTMTTLGFGDIYANPDSIMGHLLLMMQVLLGYGLLGALITRLGILFQSLGPAQDYSTGEEKE